MSFTRTLRAVGGAVVAGALLFGTAPVASADQIRDGQWFLRSFKADEIWKISTGKGVTVAVIDTGVQSQHPDLKGNILPGKSFDDGGSAEPVDGDTHGTSMASDIAGHGHGSDGSEGAKGLAPDAKILPIRATGAAHSFGPAIRYAVDKGASVINISQVASVAGDGETEAISYALKHDVLIFAGTGNDGKGGPDAIEYPARYPGVVAVGGIQSNTEIWPKSTYGPQVMLTGPAVNIVSAGDSGTSKYQNGTGTSDATAFASATAALLREKFPNLSAGQILNRMVKTAGLPDSAKGISLPDQKYGYGFIRPLRALTSDIPAGPKNGPLKMPQDQASSAGTGGQAASTGSNGSDSASQPVKKPGWSPLFIAMLVGAGVFVVVVIVVIVMLVRRKGRRNGPPPGGPGGFGGPGGPGGYAPYPQTPPQQPGAPGSYPPPPGR
ncbi:type VII secretion-associated serine protease mycosin [Streptomyces yunnanensis]|uniref:Type VII secretion-associated serine protease mycosin n=1 Tax=Streptomyces yunnanensis TaxID=156453 RepID=A0A9X8N530_9ACTN|nr:type VII secretion-associated serine protease mycosin [Streptomyces yunnanensis]SHN01198.1 type VII secretion-associated serine protease mycosin [Streptomyces yunnanensis]